MSTDPQESDLARAEREHQESEARLAAAKARAEVSHAELDTRFGELHEQLDPILRDWPDLERAVRRNWFILDRVTQSNPKLFEEAVAAGKEFDRVEREAKKP